MIRAVNNSSLSFKSSQVNILSTADNHGDILAMPQIMKAVEMNKRDMFERAQEKGTMNLFAIAGDFFLNPKKSGFLTNPENLNGDIQHNFLKKIIQTVRETAGEENEFDTVYTPGNHCFDGGDKWLFDKLNRTPMTTIMTNINLEKSPLAQDLMAKNKNIVTEKIYEIQDNKNPDLKNKILVLGVTIPAMDYYSPNLLEGSEFFDNTNKNDVLLEKEDLQNTFDVVEKSVEKFKKENPNGAVVVMAHTGNKLSSLLAERVSDIDLILNGHDHKEFEILKGKTLILSHGQNSKFLRTSQLQFDDNGKLSGIRAMKFDITKYEPIARKDAKIQEFVNENLREDLVPLVYFKNENLKNSELVLDDSIRYANNVIANYTTSAIKSALKEKGYGDVDAVGIPGSIFRNGLKSHERRSTLNNIDLLKMFDGVNEDLSGVQIGKITGQELLDLIIENVLNNLKSRTRNSLIQWSDIQVNRSLFKKIKNGESDANYYDCVKIRDSKSGVFEPINLGKEYSILMSDKYLVKDSPHIEAPSKIKEKFEKIPESYDSLFRKHLELANYEIKITDKLKEERIL